MKRATGLMAISLLSGALLMTASCTNRTAMDWQSPQYQDSKFVNRAGQVDSGDGNLGKILKRWLFERRTDPTPADALPIQHPTQAELAATSGDLALRLGHSTILLRLDGDYFLTDPVFVDRASPVQWAGPKRFHAPAMALEELPPIKAVVISHDHYDHLDKATVRQLAQTGTHFYTPLGVGQRLVRWGIDAQQVTEMDWWDSVTLGSTELVATPAQHFSGRSLWDRDSTLWASFAFIGSHSRVFFSGDTGYFDGFAEIGERYGPFDLTLMETGAYDEMWSGIHMSPEESVQAHRDLRGKAMIPIHNGTFDLALHAWYEPMERALAAAESDNQQVLTPVMGQTIQIGQDNLTTAWWRALESEGPELAATAPVAP
ncbi:MBL fold metallo-hydrolase [Ferrimonas marina]|uniref:L-ascorbate metabolism protein UlaG, beta-lactamase superfamily n=1 Tax=Ferrimonas marina TaxID=299255 RepID=A0A1M5YH74_9GAMM|nr:MBL fold metallo-hydrolase [Ferrimonas marina]SHI11239.1 L-ascorbate metabolism protein UlaG, beta-lactamase superfamily [Ferrimonas marina]